MTGTPRPEGAVPASSGAARRDRVRERLAQAGVDALLVTHLPNVRYLSGFTGSAGRLLVDAAGSDVLVTDGRYAEQAADEAGDLELVLDRGDDWLPARAGGRRLGVEAAHLSWQSAQGLADLLGAERVVPTAQLVETLRQVKDDAEVAAITRACAAGDAAWAALLGWLAPGRSEREVAHRLLTGVLEAGADAAAFEPIVASGPNGARPHHRAGQRTLRPGDLVTCDFGARVDGYASDMTRTVALGEPEPRLREVYEVVQAAQVAGLAAVRDGAHAAEVDSACRRLIGEAGYAKAFVHSTGHGLGLDLHEEPILRAGAAATLRARMAVTVEPGIYLPGVGGVRIEDTVVVTDAEPDILTLTPKDLVVL